MKGDLVVIPTNVGLVLGGIKDDSIVTDVYFCSFFETFVNRHRNVVGDGFLAMLFWLFSIAVAGLLSNFAFCRHRVRKGWSYTNRCLLKG